MFLAIAFLLVAPSSARLSYIDSALSYENTQEQGSNRGVAIDKFNSSVGNKYGSAYCGAFVGYNLKVNNITTPKGSGLARNYYTKGYKTYTAASVLKGKSIVESGDIVIWARGNTIYGHTGFVLGFNKNTKEIYTIEGNTSSGLKGSQYDGDGVFKRTRKINPYSFFRIIGFSKVKV
jgi:hypothetical protein